MQAAFRKAPTVRVFDLRERVELEPRPEQEVDAVSPNSSIVSIAASRDGKHVLLSLCNQEIQGWPLEAILATTMGGKPEDLYDFPCQTYAGMDQRLARQDPH